MASLRFSPPSLRLRPNCIGGRGGEPPISPACVANRLPEAVQHRCKALQQCKTLQQRVASGRHTLLLSTTCQTSSHHKKKGKKEKKIMKKERKKKREVKKGKKKKGEEDGRAHSLFRPHHHPQSSSHSSRHRRLCLAICLDALPGSRLNTNSSL